MQSARGAGVGAALNRAALAEAQRRGARTVDLTSRPSREAANRLYQRLGFVAPGHQRLPLGLNRDPSGRELVLGGLADLPVTVGRRPGQSLVDLGPVEGCQGDDGSAPDGRLVPGGGEDGREPGRVPMAPSAATAASRTRASSWPAARAHRRATTAALRIVEATLLATGEGHHLDHRGVVIVERGEQGHGAVGRRPARRPAGARSRLGSVSAASSSGLSRWPMRRSAPSAVARTAGSSSASASRARSTSPWCPASAATRRRSAAPAASGDPAPGFTTGRRGA